MVSSSAGQATGPVGFLRVYDQAFGEMAQGGTRRGANMAVLRVDHPDVEEFITCKTDENAITNFNISVGITDAFMQAVEHDAGLGLALPGCAFARLPRLQRHAGTGRSAPASRSRSRRRVRGAGTVREDRPPGAPQRRAGRACSWMPPTATTRCRTCTRWKPPTRAASSGWGPMRTAAWARSTWPSTWPRRVRWIGRSSPERGAVRPASWTMWWTPTPMCRPCRSSKEAADRAPAHRAGHHGPGRPDVSRRHPLRLGRWPRSSQRR